MSILEIVKSANRIERLGVAYPDDNEFWESIGDESDGFFALVVGDLDEAIVIKGTPEQLVRTAELIAMRVSEIPGVAVAENLENASVLVSDSL